VCRVQDLDLAEAAEVDHDAAFIRRRAVPAAADRGPQAVLGAEALCIADPGRVLGHQDQGGSAGSRVRVSHLGVAGVAGSDGGSRELLRNREEVVLDYHAQLVANHLRYVNDLFHAHECPNGYHLEWMARPAATNRSAALLDHLARLTRARAESALGSHGLRPRHLVALTMLRDHGGMPQHALAAALGMDRTNLVGLLNELERHGLVERRRSPEDRRRHIVELTRAGAERLAEAEDDLAEVEDDVLAGLTEAERATLYDLLRRATREHVLDCTSASREWAASSTRTGD
jgi:DNA-binding MarR family transcriptional regulator